MFGIECKCIVCSSISIMGIMCFVDIVNVSSNVDVVGYKIWYFSNIRCYIKFSFKYKWFLY